MQKLLFNNKLNYRITRHLIFILGIILLFSIVLYFSRTHHNFFEALTLTAGNSFFFLLYAYLTLFLLIPHTLLKGRIFWFVLIFAATGIFLSMLKLIFSDEIFYASISPEYFRSGYPGTISKLLVNAKDMTFIVALLCVGKFTKDFIYTEHQLRELEKQNREARQRLLQSQLNPHFLYNTINNLYALSLLEPGKTLAVTKKIQKVLAYIVEQSRYNFLNLREELDLVKNYVSLEKLRYGKRFRARVVKKGNIEEWQVPPMVLFLMAENGIRHGSRSDTGNPWLKIVVDAQPGLLTLEVANSKPQVYNYKRHNENKGNGLQNLKKRLEILYPANNYTVEIEEDERFFCIRLELSKLKNGLDKTSYR